MEREDRIHARQQDVDGFVKLQTSVRDCANEHTERRPAVTPARYRRHCWEVFAHAPYRFLRALAAPATH